MIPTFVFGWPSGDEVGDYLALDLGMFSSTGTLFISLIKYVLKVAQTLGFAS